VLEGDLVPTGLGVKVVRHHHEEARVPNEFAGVPFVHLEEVFLVADIFEIRLMSAKRSLSACSLGLPMSRAR
jgi:hypothetical protein